MRVFTTKRGVLAAGGAAALAAVAPRRRTAAQAGGGEAVRIGLILPLTGPFASTGRQVEAGVRAFLRANGESFGGRRVELLARDDTGVAPDTTRRLAQELVVRERARVLAGFGLTPLALAAAPIATEAKVPMVVMAAGSSVVVQRSPYILRTSFTLAQAAMPVAEWAAKNGVRTAATLVTDFAPGLDDLVLSRAALDLSSGVTPALVAGSEPAATGLRPVLLYDAFPGRGDLLFDADGVGGAAPVLLARLLGGPALTANDLVLIA